MKNEIRFKTGGISPEIKEYSGKFILALTKKGPISEIALYADSSQGYHREIADAFGVPRSSVIGGGRMLQDNKKVSELTWPGLNETETGIYLYDSSGDFGPVPFEIATLCLKQQIETVRTAFEEPFSKKIARIKVSEKENSSVILTGQLAIALFLAEKGAIPMQEAQKILAKIKKEMPKDLDGDLY